jgi:hypothetical protein
MRRLAEDDLVHLLCSYLSAVESSLNRYGTKVVRGRYGAKVVRGGVGERAVERTDRRPGRLKRPRWPLSSGLSLWMSLDTAQSLRTLT